MALNSLYETDFHLWIQHTIKHLQHGEFNALDINNLIEELESMGRSDKREIKTRFIVLIMHLLKWKYQSKKRSRSWTATINEQRRQIEAVLEDSPSLIPYFQDNLKDWYSIARRDAAKETKLSDSAFPLNCPFSWEQILDPDYFPDTLDG